MDGPAAPAHVEREVAFAGVGIDPYTLRTAETWSVGDAVEAEGRGLRVSHVVPPDTEYRGAHFVVETVLLEEPGRDGVTVFRTESEPRAEGRFVGETPTELGPWEPNQLVVLEGREYRVTISAIPGHVYVEPVKPDAA